MGRAEVFREALRLQEALQVHQDLVWQSMGKYSEQLGWGLTGIQPECWVCLDQAVTELVAARKLIKDLRAALELPDRVSDQMIVDAVKALSGHVRKKDVKATWISVEDQLPPDRVWVETKIHVASWNDWCLIRRHLKDGVWCDQENKWSNHPPTHWHH